MKKNISMYCTLCILFAFLFFNELSAIGESDKIRSCLMGNTKITMYDDSMKDISDVEVGDVLLSFNVEKKEYEEAVVTKVYTTMHNRLLRILVSNGTYIEVTASYPFLTPTGWVSVNPQQIQSFDRYKDENIEQLDIATGLYYYDVTQNRVLNVIHIDGFIAVTDTYSLELDNDGAFIANSLLVGQ